MADAIFNLRCGMESKMKENDLKNKSVILCGAGYRGGRNFVALAEENVHVEAFCDRDAENIIRYYGCDVFVYEKAIEAFPSLPYIMSIDNDEARKNVMNYLKKAGLEVYEDFASFFQGKKDGEVETVFCGTEVGFQIIPSLLRGEKQRVAYTFGIGFNYSFEQELAEKYGIEVYAFDPSPEVVEEMKKQVLPVHLHYFPYGLSNEDAEKTFYLPSSGTDYSEYFAPWTSSKKIQMQVYRLSTLMKKFGHSHIDILKMDIEGSEYMALPDILESDIVFDQLCIETHPRIFPDSVKKIRWIKQLLNQHGYLMVSNGRQEQTYIRRGL